METAWHHVSELFQSARFMHELGVELLEVSEGVVVSAMDIKPEYGQQDGFVHAGVVAALADHTAGAAASTCAGSTKRVLTAEYKINLLRPATGERLICRSTVLKPGRLLSVVESEVRAVEASTERLVAKARFTIALIAR